MKGYYSKSRIIIRIYFAMKDWKVIILKIRMEALFYLPFIDAESWMLAYILDGFLKAG